MQMKTFDFSLAIDTKDVSSEGEFEGYASTFGNVDLGGDIVEPGAFIESIVKARNERRTIPMLWQHDQREPIGVWKDIAEDRKGLYVKGLLLLESDPLARRAHKLLQQQAIGGMSIGYGVPAGGAEPDEKRRGITRLKKLNLREISLVTMPMNIEARVTSVKADIKDLRDRLAAGDRLQARELERLLKEQFELSNSEAERAVRLHFKNGQGAPDGTAESGSAFLRALLPK